MGLVIQLLKNCLSFGRSAILLGSISMIGVGCSDVGFKVTQGSVQEIEGLCGINETPSPTGPKITSPPKDQFVHPAITVSGTCDGTVDVRIGGGGLNPAVTTACADGQFSQAITLVSPDGLKDLHVSQDGIVGLNKRCVMLDTTPPRVLITTPITPYVNSTFISVIGECESGFDVNLSQAGGGNLTTACANGRFQAQFPSTGGDGSKTITASQTDRANNTGSDEQIYIVDTTIPIVRILTPAANTIVKNNVAVTGTCESGLPVRLVGTAPQPAVTTTCDNGQFSSTININPREAVLYITAEQTDLAGNRGWDQRNVIRDTTPPAITIVGPAAGTVGRTGLTVVGTCTNDLPVNLTGLGLATPMTVACVTGNWTAAVTFSNGDGTKNVIASQTDLAGNIGSVNRDFAKDSTAPVITITGPAIGTITRSTINLVGTCESGLPVALSGAITAMSTACSNGQFSATVTLTAPDGNKNVIASQTDGIGNVGSSNRNFVLDTIAPSITITGPAAGTTSQTGVTLVGTCTTGLTINVSGGISSPSTATCNNGSYSFPVIFSGADGSKNVIVSQTDAAGNTGSANREFVKDTTPPMITITAPAPLTVVQTGVTLQGACTDGLTVNISGTGVAQPSTTACNNGTYSTPVTFTVGDGNKNVVASQTDIAGNTGSANREFVRNNTPPTIQITAPQSNTTTQGQIVLQGICRDGLAVNITGQITAPITVQCVLGNFSSTITLTSPDGTKNVIATQTDIAGNVGSDNRNFILDTTAPVIAITAPAVNTVAQTGVTLIGTCTAGLTVNIGGSGVNAPSTTTCASGQFSSAITFSNSDGTKNVVVSQTDAAGNVGSDNRNFIKDTQGPDIRITAPAPATAAQNGLTLVGTCTTGLAVNISGTGVNGPSATGCNNGQFSSAITFSAGDGTKNVVVSQTDAAGNVGSDNRDFVKDTTAPAILITGPAAGTATRSTINVVGTCATGINVTLAGAIVAPVTTTCTNGQFGGMVTLASPDGTKNVTASQTDAVGNTGSDNRNFILSTAALNITIDAPAPNTITRSGLTLQGSCVTGLVVNISGGVNASSTTACANGQYSANIILSQGDGTKNVVVTQTDTIGNSGTANRNFILDTTAPAISFTSPNAGTVAQNGLTVTGMCETGLQVILNGGITPTSTGCNNGQFSSAITFSAGDGTKNVVASQTDAAGNTGSANRDFVKDTTAPAILITGPAAGTATRSTIDVVGTCATGINVTLAGAIVAPVTTTCTNGQFAGMVTLASPDGTKNVTASQTDAAGNTGSDNRNFVLSTAALNITINAPAPNTITRSGLTLQGNCVTGLVVNISGGVNAPSTTACANGQYSANIILSQGDGTKNVVVTQTDAIGNSGTANRNFILDATVPAISFTSPNAGTVAQNGLTVTGMCETGLQVILNGGITPTSTGCNNGQFSSPITFSAGDGTKNVVASQTDAAGNTGSANRDFVKDTTAPVITIVSPAAGTNTRSTISLTGTCTDGLAINLSGDISPSMAVCLAGSWSAVVTLLPPDGSKNVIATQTDLAGNTGSANRAFTLVTAAPTIRITAPAVDTVTRSGLTVSGTCVTGLSVSLSGGITAPATVNCAGGTFSTNVTLSGPDGRKNIVAAQTDAAGNTGNDNRNFILDTTAPLVRFSTPAAGTAAGNTLAISGTCETGLQVQLSGAGLGTPGPVSCAGGTFNATITFSAGDGVKNIIATQTDAAGNSGQDNRNFTKDTTAPVIRIATPAINAITTSGLTLTGTCESGLTVTIAGTGLNGGPSTTACTNGAFSSAITLASPDGSKNITVAQTDAVGNSGTDNRNFILDATAPRVTIASPANGTNVVGSIALQGACEAGLALNITGDITAPSITTCPAGGAYNVAITVNGGNGAKRVTATQTDAAGNIGSATANYVVTPRPSSTETFMADAGEGKVDILFVDDNSVSMETEQAALGTKFQSFVAELSGLDWQAGITTTDCSNGPWGICGSLLNMTGTSSPILTPSVPGFDQVFNNTIQRPETLGCAAAGQCPSGLEEAMKAASTAIDKRATNNAGFFRDGAALAIVVLTDEDEQSDGTLPTATRPQTVINKVTAAFGADKKFKSYAITILSGDTQCLEQQRAQLNGSPFYGTFAMELARLTGGQSVSICAPDYSVTLRQIGQDLRKLTQAVTLTRAPIPSSVQVTFTPAQNITWTVSGNTILFSRAVSAGTRIDVYYEY